MIGLAFMLGGGILLGLATYLYSAHKESVKRDKLVPYFNTGTVIKTYEELPESEWEIPFADIPPEPYVFVYSGEHRLICTTSDNDSAAIRRGEVFSYEDPDVTDALYAEVLAK